MIGRIQLERLRQPFFWLRVYWWKNRLLFGALAIGFIAYLSFWSPLAVINWLAREPSVGQAKEYALSYEAVLEDPEGMRGKAVRWHISHPGDGAWFYRGDPNKPVEWVGPEPDLVDTRRTHRMLATFGGVEDGKVRLSYVGLHY